MDIERIFEELIDELKDIDTKAHLNERYLHHRFSFLLQQDEKYRITFSSKDIFHPEWATYINDIEERHGGRYENPTKKNHIVKDNKEDNSNRGAGFIDFAIGNPVNPDFAIEFKMDNGFDHEGVIYDYMKLLDPRNHFQKAISLVVLYGQSRASKIFEITSLSSFVEKAIQRLKKSVIDFSPRPFHFYIVEIFDKVNHRHINQFECVNNVPFAKTASIDLFHRQRNH